MLKILELFAGIGACSSALDRLGIEHEIVDAVEIDKYAMASFNAIHDTNFQPQDITTWNKDMAVDLIMHGSPCQDISVAGQQAGADENSGTRSSLMYETIRIVGKLKPKYVIWENVKNLLSQKHRHNFDNYLERMESMGYKNYYQVLNAKDYGIPQNRERVFTISIRADIEKEFHFPEKEVLKLKLKDMLEEQVDEKYYLSDKIIKFYKKNEEEQKAKGNGFTFGVSDGNKVARAITTRAGSRMDDNFIQQVGKLDIKGQDCIKRVYSEEGLSPTLTTMQGGNTQPKLLIKNATKQGYDIATNGDSINLQYPDSTTRRGRVGHQVSQTLQGNSGIGVVISNNARLHSLVDKITFEEGKVLNMDLYNQTTNENISQCLTEPHHNSQALYDGLRVRKLTPKECWRLMGFNDEEFEKAEKVNSNTQLYKQAGNSIVVKVLEKILKNLLEAEND